MLTNLNQFVDDSSVYSQLNLLRVSGCHVGNRPAHLFSNRFFLVGKQSTKRFQGTWIDCHLGLLVSARQNVTDCTEARNWDLHVIVLQKLYDSWQDVCLQDQRNLRDTAVADVGKSPANVRDNLLWIILNQYFGKRGNTSRNFCVWRRWPTSAQIRKRPRRIPCKCAASNRLIQKFSDRLNSTRAND